MERVAGRVPVVAGEYEGLLDMIEVTARVIEVKTLLCSSGLVAYMTTRLRRSGLGSDERERTTG